MPYGILDLYVCYGSSHSTHYDRFWRTVHQKGAERDQPAVWLPVEHVHEKQGTWEFAHKFCGRIWYVCGLGLLAVAVIPMLFVIGEDINLVGTVGGIVCGVELVPLVGSIIPTEIALRKNLDKLGNRR